MDDVVHSGTNGQRLNHAATDTETRLLTTSIGFPIAIWDGWQVSYDRLQWVLQRWRAPRWRDRAFYRTRAGLELSIRELVGPQHQTAVAHLPDWHPDVDGVPEPKWRKRNKHRVLDLGGRKNTIARGARIRQKVVAQQHLQTSLTITLEDGSTTRVWLAAGKDGKKIIGDSLSWGLCCAGRAEIPVEMVRCLQTPIPAPNMPGALQGDDYPLEYDENGFPELPACLDRRPKPPISEAA